MIKRREQMIRLDTQNTTLVIKADTAEYLYYGKRLGNGFEFGAYAGGGKKLFSAPGKDDYTEYSILFENADGGFVADFTFSKVRILPEKPEIPGLPSSYGEGKTLELKYVDTTRAALYLYYTVFEDSDVIARHAEIRNSVIAEEHQSAFQIGIEI